MFSFASALRFVCLTGLSMLGGTASAVLLELRVESVEPFVDGKAFGEAGPYERIVATARGELDPADPRDAVIELLDAAPRNERGLVTYETDVVILAPVGGSEVLLYDVTNRGSKVGLGLMNDVGFLRGASGDPYTREVGNGFLLERGYALVWSGWDPTVPERPDAMRATLPVALVNGLPVEGRVRDEFTFGIFPAEVPPSARLSYSALRDRPAALSVRQRERDVPRELAATDWEWVDDEHIALRKGDFEPAALYDFRYTAAGPPVLGMGFAITRDLVSFLRNDAKDAAGRPNPLRGRDSPRPRFALGMGVSQAGRFLRHFVELGMNQDVRGRRVFDGLLPYISGIGKVFANHAFGQPGRTAGQHIGRLFPENWYPFAYAAVRDPLTGGNAGLLRGDGFDPKILEVNTESQTNPSLVEKDPYFKGWLYRILPTDPESDMQWLSL